MLWKKKQFWGTLIAIVLLGWCLKDVRLSTLESLASRMNYLYLVPCLLSGVLFVALRAARWRVFIPRQKRLPMSRAVTLYAAGQVINMVMPALTGQVGRIILFARKEGLRKTFVFSSIVLEVLFDAVSLLILLMMTSLACAFPERYRSAGIVV